MIQTISRKDRKVNNYLRKISLTHVQKQFLVGHILGDGCIHRDSPNSMYRVQISQKEQHYEYFHWKLSLMQPFVRSWRRNVDKRGNSVMLHANTICHNDFKEFADMFYINRIKHIPDCLEQYLTPLALAVLIMDDGNLNHSNLRLATHSFSKNDNFKLKDYLYNLYKIESNVFQSKQYFRLALNKENTIKISNLVRPYIVNVMSYKISKSSTTTCQTFNSE